MNSIKLFNILVVILHILIVAIPIKARHHMIFRKSISKKSIDCKNPETDYLENLLTEYNILYRKYEETIYKTRSFEKNEKEESLLNKDSYEHIFDNTQCRFSERNTTDISKRSMCPWQDIINYREDRFPHYYVEAKCNCKTCNRLGDVQLPNSYGCLPVLRPTPVLVRGDCMPDGYYRWKPSIENVNVACTCGFSHQLLPK